MRSLLFCGLMAMGVCSSAWSANTTAVQDGNESRFLTNPRQVVFAGARSQNAHWSQDEQHLVFQAEREESNPFFQVYLQNTQTGEVELVSPGAGKAQDAALHPEKQRILFASTHLDKESRAKQKKELEVRASGKKRHGSGDYDENFDLFSSDLRGRKLKRLTKAKGYDAEASYSPDGKWIVFASNRAAYSGKLSDEEQKAFAKNPAAMMDLYLMRSDGQDLKRLTEEPGYDGAPVFSPDGEKVLWHRALNGGHQYEVYIMNRDGSDQRALTKSGRIAWTPTFHPSGDYIVYSAMTEGHNFELFMIAVDSPSQPVRLTFHKAFDSEPVFTPDGEQLMWTSSRNSGKQSHLFVADWNGKAAREALGLPSPRPLLKSYQPEIDLVETRRTVEYLASAALEGRLTGSEGQKQATQFAADYFSYIGLKPAGDKDSFFDTFEFSSAVELGDLNELHIKNTASEWEETFQVKKDWVPLVFSGIGKLDGPGLVFAGYGIEAPEGQGYEAFNSYQDLDVKDKWVMVFRYMPEDLPAKQKQYLARFSKLNHKAMVARDRGARGLIIVSGPRSKVKKDLVPLERHNVAGSISLPVISVTDRVAHQMLSQLGHNIMKYQEKLDQGEAAILELKGFEISGFVDLKRKKKTARNVLARLQAGAKPSRRVVIVGAHMDHLGRGQTGNTLAKGDEKGKIHFGADDNASGVAAVMELAHFLNSQKNKAKWQGRADVIFALWSGEELGTLGSSHFVSKHLEKENKNLDVLAYLNLDMVGRYEDSLNLQALGSSSEWIHEVEKARTHLKLNLVAQKDPYLPTDSTPFYLKEVPVLAAFTGVHQEYHSPRDTAEKLNYEALTDVAKLMAALTYSVAEKKKPLEYVKVPRKSSPGSRSKMRVYLGTIPDYSKTDTKGVALMGVQENGPAAKAGLKSGDVIVKMAGRKIENLYDFTNVMTYLKPDEKTTIVVKREGKEVDLEVTPESRE